MNENLTFEQVMDAQKKYIQLEKLHWLKYELFSFQFWFLLAMLIIPWFIWWKLVDKRRFLEIMSYGFLVIISATFLDDVGCQINLWEYHYDIEPLFPRLIPMNFTMLPISYMFVYQYFTEWKPFIIANIIAAAIYAFIGEPIFVMLKIYNLINWKHIYSFPIYVLLAVLLKLIVVKIMVAQQRGSLK